MGILDYFGFGRRERLEVTRDKTGSWYYWMPSTAFNNVNQDYLRWFITNPVLFSVVATRAKLYSQMKITAHKENGDELTINEVPHLKLISKPNYFQSQQDWLYQQMVFLSATGNNIIYQKNIYSNDEPPKAMYNLYPADVDYKKVQEIDKFFTLDKDVKSFEEQAIKYRLHNQTLDLKIKDLIPLYDVCNGLEKDTMFKSTSRVSALTRNLANIEENMASENINLQFSQKYLAKNNNNIQGVSTQIHEDDREAIRKVIQDKSLQITNGDIEVKHLVSDLKRLYLSEIFGHDAMVICNAFEINPDVISYALGGSTYENQQYGIIRYIQNSIQPDADNLMNSLTNSWGLDMKGIKLKASYNHLPVMQPLYKEKITTFTELQNSIKIGIANQTISIEEAKEMTVKLRKELGL